jgi:hypothetical protein
MPSDDDPACKRTQHLAAEDCGYQRTSGAALNPRVRVRPVPRYRDFDQFIQAVKAGVDEAVFLFPARFDPGPLPADEE